MNIAQQYLALCGSGIDLVAAAATLPDLGTDAPDSAEKLQRLADIYFGTGNAKAQRECIDLARKHRLTIVELETIETWAGRARTKRDAWTLRKLLITTPAKRRRKVANKKLAELNPPKPQEPEAKITRSENSDIWKITLNGPSDRISSIWDSLDDKSFDGFEEAFFTGTARPSYVPHVIIPVEGLTKTQTKTQSRQLNRYTTTRDLT